MLPAIGDKIRTQQSTTDNNNALIKIKAKGTVIATNDDPFYPIIMEGINERRQEITLHVREDGWTAWTD